MIYYADEAFYKEKYLMGRKPVIDAGFQYYAMLASKIIDQHTFGRLKDISEEEILDEVKMCCCELAERMFAEEKGMAQTVGGKTSEKIGTYSVTYSDAHAVMQAAEDQQKQIIRRWLGDIGLLYQGVC